MKNTKKKKKEQPFGKNLCLLMEQKKLTIAKAAKIASCSVSTISDWRSGSSPGDYSAVKKLATYLGVSLDYILTGDAGDLKDNPILDNSIENLVEVGDMLFEGYALISVQRIIPKNKK